MGKCKLSGNFMALLYPWWLCFFVEVGGSSIWLVFLESAMELQLHPDREGCITELLLPGKPVTSCLW